MKKVSHTVDATHDAELFCVEGPVSRQLMEDARISPEQISEWVTADMVSSVREAIYKRCFELRAEVK